MSEFFNLKRGCGQGDPISSYIYVRRILGKMVRDNEIIIGININGKEFRLSHYADDNNFFLMAQNNHLKKH